MTVTFNLDVFMAGFGVGLILAATIAAAFGMGKETEREHLSREKENQR